MLRRLLSQDSTETAPAPGPKSDLLRVSVPSWGGRRAIFSGRLLDESELAVTIAAPESLAKGQMVWLEGASRPSEHCVEACSREADGWRLRLQRRTRDAPRRTP